MGHLAEAIMTKSFINPRLSKHFAEKEKVNSMGVSLEKISYTFPKISKKTFKIFKILKEIPKSYQIKIVKILKIKKKSSKFLKNL